MMFDIESSLDSGCLKSCMICMGKYLYGEHSDIINDWYNLSIFSVVEYLVWYN